MTNSALFAQTQWTKVGNGPVLDVGAPGEWDALLIEEPHVIYDRGLFKMWYSGAMGWDPFIGYAISSDRVTWRKYENNPILEAGQVGGWDWYGVKDPSVIYDEGIYKMWYTGRYVGIHHCMYAVSDDGIHWTKVDSVNPVLDPGPPGSWDTKRVSNNVVIKNDSIYYMWYKGFDSNGNSKGIGLATSPDGIHFTKYHNNPIIISSQGWDKGIWPEGVIYTNDEFKMWYGGASDGLQATGYATSLDGVVWEKYGDPVLVPGDDDDWDNLTAWPGSVILLDGIYHMWYGNTNLNTMGQFGYATSSDTPATLVGEDQDPNLNNFISYQKLSDISMPAIMTDPKRSVTNINKHVLTGKEWPNLESEIQDIEFEHFTIEKNAKILTVNSIIQDHNGFIWFSTLHEIVQYNGTSFISYGYDPSDSNSLSYPNVRKLYEDHLGFIWIGTNAGGLNRLDPKTGRITHFRHDPDNPKSLSGVDPLEICEDSNGLVWIGTDGSGLNLFERETETFTRYKHNPNDPNSLIYNRINDLAVDPEPSGSIIWIATIQGLDRFDYDQNLFTHYQHEPDNINSLSSSNIVEIEVSPSGKIWVGTLHHGINSLDPKTGHVIRFKHDPMNPNSLSHNNIQSLKIDRLDEIWIGAGDSKLNRLYFRSKSPTPLNDDDASISEDLSKQEPVFVHYQHDSMNTSSLSKYSPLIEIFEDGGGSIWIGGVGDDINKFDPPTVKFRNHQKITGQSNSLSHDMVNDLYGDSQGILWVATSGGGLNKIARDQDVYTNYMSNHEDSTSIGSNYINRVYGDPDYSNIIWIGATNGLYQFTISEDRFIRLTHGQDISDIEKDESGNLWFSCKGHGLYQLKPNDGTLINYRHVSSDSNSLSDDYILDIHVDQNEDEPVIWVGTEKGITRFDVNKDSYQHYTHNPIDSTSLSDNIVNSIFQDEDNGLWVNTQTSLHRFQGESQTFTRYNPVDDIDTHIFHHINQDHNGNLWIGSSTGLWRFNPETERFKRFDADDGLAGKDITSRSFFNRITGEMFVGGSNGFSSFYPDNVHDNKTIPNIVLTSFKKFNEEVKLDTFISYKKQIILNYDENVFSFEFAALNYINFEKNQYAYKMEGFDKDWVYIGTKREVAYTNLDPGEYTFRVKGSNNDDVWNEKGTSLKITILSPWFKTNWAYAIYVFIIIVVFIQYKNFELNRIKLRQKYELEHFEASKLKEMDELKSHFFANISHEFRTPLTLILGPIQKLLSRNTDSDSEQELNMMQKQANRLLGLVTQLLDLSRLEAKRMKLKASERNIIPLLKGTVLSFASLADTKKIILTFNSDNEIIQVYCEKDIIVKIMNNLLSNAFKFTKDKGKIDVTVETSTSREKEDEDSLTLTVSDTGIGIAPDIIENIFNRFYQVDSSKTREHEGTGIGLSLTKELVELHRGTLSVESTEGEGSTFTVTLPLGKSHLNPDEIVENLQEETTSDLEIFHSEPEPEPKKPSIKKGVPLVLLVEDNVDVRRYTLSYLDDYRVIEAGDGEDGLKQAFKKIPDLIVSDIMMPKMDGVEFCKRIKTDQRTSHIPVILLTAKADMESKLEGLETGADDYLTKPFEAQELQMRVKNLIEQRQRMRDHFSKDLNIQPKDLAVNSMDEQFLLQAIEIIDQHMDDSDYSVINFSDEMAMSRRHLNRKLQAITDHSASGFIRVMRLKRAAQLLQRKSATVLEIAYAVGFTNPSHFANSFRKQFGFSPSKYSDQLSSE